MIVEQGIFTPVYREATSIEAALASGNAGEGVAWIGLVEPTNQELVQLGLALGASDQSLAEIRERDENIDPVGSKNSKPPIRACAEVLESIVHLLVRGPARWPTGTPSLEGDIEVLATRQAVVVATRGVASEFQPQTMVRLIAKSLSEQESLTGADIVGLLISLVFDWYEDVLDEVERQIAEIADVLFGERRMEILPQLYALARPLHGATVAVQPFEHGLDRVLQEIGEEADHTESLDWRNDAEHLAVRVARLDALLVSTLQVYLGRSQDEANALADKRNDITQRMSAYALLLAIPTIVFSIYGTNFQDIWVLHTSGVTPSSWHSQRSFALSLISGFGAQAGLANRTRPGRPARHSKRPLRPSH